MEFETLALSEEGGILHVKLNRPEKRNAVNNQILLDLERCFSEVATGDNVRVVILSGEGKAFCAGTDLNQLGGSGRADGHGIRQLVRRAQRAFSAIENLEKAVIALIHGYAMGAGTEMILGCDLRIASEEATFNIPEVDLGLVPDLGGSQRLPRVVGVGRAKELILTGKTISAAEAERIGLVNKVVPLEELQETGRAWAEEIMSNEPVAVGLAKRNIDMSFGQSLADGLESAAIAQSILLTGDDFRRRIEQKIIQKNQGKKVAQPS
ncbi:MAG: enoyl-CoA hydratase/isomerase family protein [Dehalococcoidia bacterium]|nr:enoyl-CoA hydratase/isomerase family protein [Dehalococcoidia bacterium]